MTAVSRLAGRRWFGRILPRPPERVVTGSCIGDLMQRLWLVTGCRMIKIITGGAAFGAAIWLTFVNVEQKAAATATRQETALTDRPMILPFELMANHGKTLPVEQWPAFSMRRFGGCSVS